MMKANREDLKSSQAEKRSIVNAWMTDINDARKKTTACQYEMEPNPGEKETAVERQEIPNEEVAVHSQRACRSETAASQEARRQIQRRLSQNQERCSPWRSIRRSLRKKS
jgi:hypothetical protein